MTCPNCGRRRVVSDPVFNDVFCQFCAWQSGDHDNGKGNRFEGRTGQFNPCLANEQSENNDKGRNEQQTTPRTPRIST